MPRPLASIDWLRRHLDRSVLRLADVRWYLDDPAGGRREYHNAHIPGAFYVDLEADLSVDDGPGRHPLPDWHDFAERMGELGIGDDSIVVAYDDRGGAVAARLWWMLRAIGHDRAFVLDGGIQAWVAAGLPVTDELPDHAPARLTVVVKPDLTVDREQLRARLPSTVTIDARAGQRYRGETEPIDPVAGHIPGARNAPYEENLDPHQFFLPAEDLAARYRALGVGEHTDVIVYCGSGVTACHDILAMEHASLGRPILYPGSWSDWSAAGYEVATGPEPGRAPIPP